MTLSVAQQQQIHRLPTGDSLFNKADRFALHWVPQALSPNLEERQRRSMHRLGIGDSSLTDADRFSLHWIPEILNTGGAVLEVWDVSWQIGPTWTANLLPVSNDGSVQGAIEAFGVSLKGTNADPPVAEDTDTGTGNSGGYGWENEYDAWRRRTKRKRKIRKITRQRVQEIEDPRDREIAAKIHRRIEAEALEGELSELALILNRAETAELIARLENLGLLEAYEAALEAKTFSSLQKLERLMDESYSEEEETFMLLLSL